jgi:predicted dehydrogenase
MTSDKVRWGVISTARIAIKNVIPALQAGKSSEIIAIASRDKEKARQAAEQFGIQRYYGAYEAMLEDPDIDAVYNPLPNHLHVPLSQKAIEAGKHVLCEKPIARNSTETMELIESANRYPGIKVMEAFMYRFHPQWKKVKEMIAEGKIGELRTVTSHFSYFNDHAENYRNIQEYGGGGLLDIGCYAVSSARYLFGEEPEVVNGTIEFDPDFHVDRMVSGVMRFHRGSSVFTCATQLFPYQHTRISGTSGQIELNLPFNPLPALPAQIAYTHARGTKMIDTEPVDQYMLMGEAFAQAILEQREVPTPLSDALQNMKVIDAIFRSNESGHWEKP